MTTQLSVLKKNGQWLKVVQLLTSGEASLDRAGQLSELGFAHSQLDQYEAAKKCYDEWLELEPQSARAFYCRGYIDYQQGADQKAIGYFKKALALFPDYLVCLYRLGVVLLRDNQKDAARDALKKAITLYQNNNDDDYRRRHGKYYYKAIYQLGKVYFAKKRFNHAAACFNKVLSEDNRHYNEKGFVLFNLAKCAYSSEDYRLALKHLDSISDRVGKQEYTHDLRGRCYFRLGKAAAALTAFGAALKRKPAGYIFRDRALAHILAKDYEAAKKDLDVALRKDRLGKHKTLLILGEVSMLQNSYKTAIAYFTQAIDYKQKTYEADYRQAHMALAEAYDKIGEATKARDHYALAAEQINYQPEAKGGVLSQP
jgi:tetratricopeptide (TPR) repeat protein